MLTVLLSILGFVAVLVVLIVIHEAGHFLAAKLARVKVLEFGVGFPPRLWGLRRGETVYSINAVPLGGFVKMLGEEDPSEPGSLAGKGTATRFVVMAAGPFMNLLMAVALFSALFVIPKDVPVGDVSVVNVLPESPAAQAGVLPGDVVLEANGRALDNDADLRYQIALSLGQEMSWLVQRGREQVPLTLVPRVNPPEGAGATGISVQTRNVAYEKRSEALWRAPMLGLQRTGHVLVLIKNEITKWISGGAAPEVTGPVGMAHVFGEVAQADGFRMVDRIITTLNLAAVISLSLGIFNLLPIPALDGGRILFVAIEWVRRGKRISPQREGLVHLVGFAVLIMVAILITFADLDRIFRGESLIGG